MQASSTRKTYHTGGKSRHKMNNEQRKQVCKVEVIVRREIFYDPDSSFTIARVYPQASPDPSRDKFPTKGILGRLHEGEHITLIGTWGSHPTFGRQFDATGIELPDPKKGGVEIFLKCGFLKGVGPALGERIYEKFGDKTLDILDEDPNKLLEVKGIGKSKIEDIKFSWVETRGRREALSFFSQWNVTPNQINKILDRWPNVRDAIKRVKDNPYILAWEIRGVGFTLADKIAATMGIPQDSKMRVEAGIGYALDQASLSEGHCYLPREILIERVADFLNPKMKGAHSQITYDKVNECISILSSEQKIIIEDTSIYLKPIHATEIKLADNIRRLMNFRISTDTRLISQFINEYEKINGFSLHENQRRAVVAAASQKVVIITGGPGTGKTTIIKCLRYVCDKLKIEKIKMAAPTGKAAQRMQESCGLEASTIHRLLGYSQGGMKYNEKSPLKTAMLICDESSMIDVFMGKSICCALPDPARLVLVGDINQLPAVRAGNVLKDLIRSQKLPVVYLTEVYRQSKNSFIPHNAKAVLQGKANLLNFKETGDGKVVDDSFFMPVPMSEGEGDEKRDLETEEKGKIARKHLTRSVIRLIQKGYDPKDIMVLSPAWKGQVGVNAINELMQGLLNSNGLQVGNTSYRVGDRVMQTKNNYDKEVMNGDQGYIAEYNVKAEIAYVQYEGRLVQYELESMREITLAYCITVHKSQGMESPVVIQFVSMSQIMMLNRNILYTGITRAKQCILLIGERKALGMAVWKNEAAKRFTSLGQRI